MNLLRSDVVPDERAKKRHPPRGCDILLSGQHPLDIRLETLVVLHSDPCGERLGRKMLGNTVPTTELRIGPPAQ